MEGSTAAWGGTSDLTLNAGVGSTEGMDSSETWGAFPEGLVSGFPDDSTDCPSTMDGSSQATIMTRKVLLVIAGGRIKDSL